MSISKFGTLNTYLKIMRKIINYFHQTRRDRIFNTNFLTRKKISDNIVLKILVLKIQKYCVKKFPKKYQIVRIYMSRPYIRIKTFWFLVNILN